MKYMFASDIHGSAYYCRKMLDAFEKEGAERLVLLGDLRYHGPRKTKFMLCAVTVRQKWIRWFWSFR